MGGERRLVEQQIAVLTQLDVSRAGIRIENQRGVEEVGHSADNVARAHFNTTRRRVVISHRHGLGGQHGQPKKGAR